MLWQRLLDNPSVFVDLKWPVLGVVLALLIVYFRRAGLFTAIVGVVNALTDWIHTTLPTTVRVSSEGVRIELEYVPDVMQRGAVTEEPPSFPCTGS
jgi:hypothetical protein